MNNIILPYQVKFYKQKVSFSEYRVIGLLNHNYKNSRKRQKNTQASKNIRNQAIMEEKS